MKTKVILATGLGQGQLSNGMRSIRTQLKAIDEDMDVSVHSFREKMDGAKKLAKEIKAWYADGDRIVMAGHSFGVWFITIVNDLLCSDGIKVKAIVSADGVNRPLNEPFWIPNNVMELYVWYQSNGIVKGSRFDADHKVRFHMPVRVYVKHPFVDEVKEFQDTVICLATGG